MARLHVLNPVAQTVEQKVDPAPRLGELKGKTIALYWNLKAGGDVALQRVQELLDNGYEGLTFKWYIPSQGFLLRHGSPEEFDRIAGECDAVIGTTND